jgi:hypothetical protein
VGVQLLSLGLVADLLGRTYHEAQRKPPYYIRSWAGVAPPESPSSLPPAGRAFGLSPESRPEAAEVQRTHSRSA